MLQVGADVRTCTDRAVQWSPKIDTPSRGTLLDVVNDAIFTEISPTAFRTVCCVCADRVDLPAGSTVDAMTRKGKHPEMEKRERAG